MAGEFSSSQLLDRDDAIRLFGASYYHSGKSDDAIVELLGKRMTHPDAASGGKLFQDLGSAQSFVRDLLHEESNIAILEAAQFNANWKNRLKLGFARFRRSKAPNEVGLLATEAVIDRRRRDAKATLKSGSVATRYIPEILRCPVTLGIGEKVLVADARDFPSSPIAIGEDRIASRHIVDVKDHPAFDYVIRYRLERLEGFFAYDVVDGRSEELIGGPEGTMVFLDEKPLGAKLLLLTEQVRLALEESIKIIRDVSGIAELAPPAPEAVTDNLISNDPLEGASDADVAIGSANATVSGESEVIDEVSPSTVESLGQAISDQPSQLTDPIDRPFDRDDAPAPRRGLFGPFWDTVPASFDNPMDQQLFDAINGELTEFPVTKRETPSGPKVDPAHPNIDEFKKFIERGGKLFKAKGKRSYAEILIKHVANG